MQPLFQKVFQTVMGALFANVPALGHGLCPVPCITDIVDEKRAAFFPFYRDVIQRGTWFVLTQAAFAIKRGENLVGCAIFFGYFPGFP